MRPVIHFLTGKRISVGIFRESMNGRDHPNYTHGRDLGNNLKEQPLKIGSIGGFLIYKKERRWND